jgi:cell division transport system permease protein
MNPRFVLAEVGTGLRRNLTMTLASIITIMITLILLGMALVMRSGADRLQHDLLANIEVSVFFNPACGTSTAGANCATPADRAAVQTTLQHLPQVQSITYISPASAYQRFKDDFAGDPDFVKNVPANSLPDSFSVKLHDPEQFEVVHSAVSGAPGVQTVTNANSGLKALFTFLHAVTFIGLLIALLLLVGTGLLIFNMTRVSAYSRRRETGIMRLVGASDLLIQAPFVLEGTVAGLIGSAAAAGLLCVLKFGISGTLQQNVLRPFGEWSTFAGVLPTVVVVGVVLSTLASFVTLQRHLRV